jgi:hypothetical protein
MMSDNNQRLNSSVENKTKIFKNGVQSGTNYVQTAIENAVEPTRDATQNLVNNVMKEHQNEDEK